MRRVAYMANGPIMRVHDDVSDPATGQVSSGRTFSLYEIATARLRHSKLDLVPEMLRRH